MDINDGQLFPNSPAKNKNNVEDVDFYLEQSAWNLEQLKEAAVEQRVLRPRSLAWAILLRALPPPNADIVTSLKSHRNFYNDLKAKLSMDPRGVIGDDPLSQNDEEKAGENIPKNNALPASTPEREEELIESPVELIEDSSAPYDSVWRQHFCDNELKTLILQDVVRTFPDELFFREKDVQDLMVRVLFYWSRSHSYVGYRQGMHEILAPLLFELYLDRKLAPKEITDRLKYILSEDHLEHDSYMLFSVVMKGLEQYYTTGDVIAMPLGIQPKAKVIHSPNEVVRYLDRVREEYLVPLDSELATHLQNSNISMELFGIRWLRLLFGREFPRSELPHLWGFLFADGSTMPNLHYVCVAMLLAVRSSLLEPDPGVVLSALMRPLSVSVGHVIALALHLRSPLQHPRPPEPQKHELINNESEVDIEAHGCEVPLQFDSGSEGVAEGADVARELAALAVVRAHLPAAAAALAAALPTPSPSVQRPLQRVLQLAALLQCRNHALIDVETALEAAEGETADKVGRRQLVPVAVLTKRKTPNKLNKQPTKVKEVPLKLFHQVECKSSDLPCLDPLRLRTE